MFGYKGKMLKLDLTHQTYEEVNIPKDWYGKYLGGEGFAAKILFDALKPGIDPLGEENLIVLATGPLTGTKAPSSGRLCFAFKSPLTGSIGLSNVGGHLAPMIKRAGYDVVVIMGKSDKPVYVYINDGKIEFKSAEYLWGLDTENTEIAIRDELGNTKVRIAEIGPAGENLVRFASIMIDQHRAAGRGGPGAVMGSKNLKALAFFGTEKIDVYDDEAVKEAGEKARQELKDEEFIRDELEPYGTPSFTDAISGLGILPTKNWQDTSYDMDKIGNEAYHKILKVKAWACYGCPIGCGRHTEIVEGDYKGDSGGGPEYETIAAFGSKCLNDDINTIAKANYLCNRLGLDTISAGQIIATAMEWYERGLIDKATTEGLNLEFGNKKSIVEMVKQMAFRKGFGDVLAEGSLRAAKVVGKNAEDYVFHVKGMEMSGCGVRASKGEALSYMISPRGADHLRPYASVIDAFGYTNNELGIDEKFSPLEDGNKAWVKPFMELSMLTNILGVCLFASITLAVKASTWTEIYNGVTGTNMEYKELLKVAERVINLERLFNAREGFDKKDDKLPKRLLTEPAKDGIGKGQVVNTEIMLADFYKAMGWDVNTGLPTKDKLEELDLSE